MKSHKALFPLVCVVIILCTFLSALASCGNPWIDAIIGDKFNKKPGGRDGPSDGGGSGSGGLSVLYDLEDFGGPADEYRTFAAGDDLQTYLTLKAPSGDKLAVTLEGAHTLNPVTSLTNGTVISFRGNGTVQLGSTGRLFEVNHSASKLILRGPTLTGSVGNTNSLIVVSAGSLAMRAGALTGNTTGSGGGVFVSTAALFTMSGGTISDNTSSSNGGGGVYIYSGTFTMFGGNISGNTAGVSGGGGVYAGNGSSFTMSGGNISGNTTPGSGGGVLVRDNASFIMSTGSISSNTATNGSGVYATTNGTFTMNGGNISGNTSVYTGGGVYVESSFTMNAGTIRGFVNSHASGHDPTLTRDNCNVVWNGGAHQPLRGAAVYNNTGSPLSIPGAAGIPGNAIADSSGYDGDIIVP